MKNILRKILLKRIDTALNNKHLRYVNEYQIANFESLWPTFDEVHSYYLSKALDSDYIDSKWAQWCKSITSIYENKEKFLRFASHTVIKTTMTGEPVFDKNRELLEYISTSYKRFIHEDIIGNNLILNREHLTSGPRLAHLYVASIITNICHEHSLCLNNILELGGGFGGLMSLFIRNDSNLQFRIYDLPELLPLQYMYINTVCRYAVDDQIISHENFRSVNDIEPRSCEGGVFISNWALTESTKVLQNIAISTNFFSASCAFICCEDNNINHTDSRYIHEYLKKNASAIIDLKATMSKSKLYFIDLRKNTVLLDEIVSK